VIMISEKLPAKNRREASAAIEAVLRLDIRPDLRKRAEKILAAALANEHE
jgi:hypothetical protein